MSKIMKGLLVVCGAVLVFALPALAGQPIPPRNMPEPSTIAMLLGGLGTVAGFRYYKLRKR